MVVQIVREGSFLYQEARSLPVALPYGFGQRQANFRKPDQTPVFGGSFHIPNYGENLPLKQATEQKT